MVYCGKPSRGCQMCRTRRIKCDETKPTCLQCQKSRRQCPGYKDDFDLVFRNETQATERRARRSINSKKIKIQIAERSHGRHDPDRSPLSASSDSHGALMSASSAASLPGSIDIPVEHQAAHYFLANFVLLPQLGSSRGHLGYVLPLLKNESPDTHLYAAFKAVSFASLGNRPNSKMLLAMAGQHYSNALQKVNKALTNPSLQKTDQTLASVLLLGLFETITLRRATLGSWGTHIDGAIMLLKMRGRKQLRTAVGRSLFLAVRTQMLINCMSASKSPDLGVSWWTRVEAVEDVAGVVGRLSLLTCELRADVNRAMTLMPRTPENWERTMELLHRAQDLEQQFIDWGANLPEEWQFKTIAWADGIQDSDLANSEVYPGKVDVYPDLFIATSWNMVRVARLFLSGIVIRCAAWICAPVDYRTTPDYAQASRLGIEMINDMVASVPYHLGWRGFRSHSGDDFKMSDIAGFPCGENDLANGKMLGAFSVVWPLFTASCSDFTTDAQRRFIIGRMKHMTEVMGLNGAAVLTQFQLRLPSMIVKRDLMCMFAAAGKIPTTANAAKPLVNTFVPTTSSSYPSDSSTSPSVSPTIKSPLTGPSSATASISASPVSARGPPNPLYDMGAGPPIKVESHREAPAEDEAEDEAPQSEAQLRATWEKKRAEKAAFDRGYAAAIKETSGDNVDYLYSDAKAAGTASILPTVAGLGP